MVCPPNGNVAVKLIIAIVHDRNKQRLTDALVAESISYTKLGSTGGFLRQGNATLLIAVESEQVDQILTVIRTSCKSAERFVPVAADPASALSHYAPSMGGVVRDAGGGAVAFVLNIEEFHRL